MTDFVPVRKDIAEFAAQELEETAEFVDLPEQQERHARLLEASESLRVSLAGDHDGKFLHPSLEDCRNDEAYLDTDSVDEYLDSRGWIEVRTCPTCNRRFEYVFEPEDGYFDTEEQEYVSASILDGEPEIDHENGYYDGQNYSVPLNVNGRYEKVYILDRLVHYDMTVATF